MTTDDHQILLLQKENGTSETYTRDGSVDFHGHPILKRKTGNWKACYFILGTECCERLAFYGIKTNLVNYLIGKLHQGNVSAATIVATWIGTCNLTPLLGGFLADAYWGRYWTIIFSSIVYFIGLCILILSASLPALKPAECVGSGCPPATGGQFAIFFAGLYLMALGEGGIKPCVSAFGADQFDDTDPIETVKKGSFFDWFYFSFSIGSILANTVIVWIQENVGWGIGFAIPTLFMGIAIASFYFGTHLYRFQRPGGSPLTRIYQDVIASICKVDAEVQNDNDEMFCQTPKKDSRIANSRKIKHTEDLRFLNVVAIPSDVQMNIGDTNNLQTPRMITEVSELTILIRMFPIWITGVVYSAVFAQTSTIFIEQGTVMNRSIGSFSIPAASLSMFIMISIFLWVPIYDKLLRPLAIRVTGNEKGIIHLHRIGVGLCLSILPMLCAAFLEIKRLELARELKSLNICWQIPQYLLMGFSDAITFVGKLEFFYDQSPDTMKCLCTALCLLIASMGQYLSSLILTIVTAITTSGGRPGWIPDDLNEGQLHKYFLLWACLSFLNLLVFLYFAMRYKDRRAV